ncbi:MAG: hypothetical protein C4306_10420 [Thermoleophilia bacterium]
MLDCNRYDDRSPREVGLRAAQVRGGTNGRFALLLEARGHAACTSQAVRDFDPQALYRISLDYLRVRGAAPRLCVWQDGPGRCATLPPLKAGKGWRHYEYAFRPASGTVGLSILLYADGRRGGTTVLYDNVRLERYVRTVTTTFSVPGDWADLGSVTVAQEAPPEVRLERVGSLPRLVLVPEEPPRSDVSPRLKVQRVSPVKYRVTVGKLDRPILLVLRETFDPGWRLEGVPGARHVRVNGYANGWVIKPRRAASVSLVYGPQRWVEIARLASIVAAAVSLLLVRPRWRRSPKLRAAGAARD